MKIQWALLLLIATVTNIVFAEALRFAWTTQSSTSQTTGDTIMTNNATVHPVFTGVAGNFRCIKGLGCHGRPAGVNA
ncbi:unnamed protein product [Protopolystoma xenopodis]|uniref:Uncharacterized protein n=1 Tax=Protopolystoma xenopodis TaxID=117903 RepID=A0A3S5A8L8_9PLAT|nr:unnamed protein product [Protopolystoma xenopodis]